MGEIFKITWREFANLLFKLAEKFLQHGADGLGKQRIGLLADPDDIGAPAVDEVGIDKLTLVIVDVKTNLDTVGNEGPTRGAVFPMQNLRDDHVVGLCKILGVDLFNSHGDRDGRDGVRVVLQFLGQRLDDLKARRRIDGVTVHTVDWGDQKKS